MSVCMQKSERTMCAKKFIFLNPAACSCENGTYLESTIDYLAAISYEIIDTPKNRSNNNCFSKKYFNKFFY